MRISFLHTVPSNQRIFETAVQDFGLPPANCRHELRADLREAVERAGTITAGLQTQIADCLHSLASDADAVVLTCAMLGPAVAKLGASPAPVLRADLALAAAAVENGTRIVVLCAAESALESNRKLFGEYASHRHASVAVVHLPQVWDLFKAGDFDACHAAIATAAHDAYRDGADAVAFAHPWMAPAVQRFDASKRPLDSAHAVIGAVMKLLAETPASK
ncbi:arylsulfatase [Paraburkholderia sp. D15]|uniref:arylsulfatase n=1 Tax=Paraburkholderia sp. D15 TaxID=2880218 RepID=UPI002479D44B|nr:arylsulfatase [Paraburkholderia sp. D15]WGS52717.1 arylsulfatase [Paraburkholderia sp. D15]